MPAVKAANPKTIFAPEDWAAITHVSGWKGIAQIIHAWTVVALAAFGAAPFIFPDKKIHLQYTTTSPKLHKVLGVESPVFD